MPFNSKNARAAQLKSAAARAKKPGLISTTVQLKPGQRAWLEAQPGKSLSDKVRRVLDKARRSSDDRA